MITFNSLIPVSKITCNGLAIKLAFLVDSIWLFCKPECFITDTVFCGYQAFEFFKALDLGCGVGAGEDSEDVFDVSS